LRSARTPVMSDRAVGRSIETASPTATDLAAAPAGPPRRAPPHSRVQHAMEDRLQQIAHRGQALRRVAHRAATSAG
jgi:hypothetical protein